MSNAHFSNTGQKLQLAVAVAALFLAFINAIPSIKNVDLFAVSPMLFFLTAILFAFFIRRETNLIKQPSTQVSASSPFFDRLPEGNKIANEIKAIAFSLKLGERRIFAQGTNELAVTLDSIDNDSKNGPFAEISVSGFLDQFEAGEKVERIANKKFKIPASKYQDGIISRISFSTTSFGIDLIRVDHINSYGGTAEITLLRSS